MKNVIIALLFRVTTGKKDLANNIEYILFTCPTLLTNPDFQDPNSQTLITKLRDSAVDAAKAATQAESRATADIKAKNQKVKLMDKAYKQVALNAEDICNDDETKAADTGLILRKKRSKKNPEQPQHVSAESGLQVGEIDAKCKAQGQGITYLWYIRKESETKFTGPETTTKARITFKGLETGVNYVAYVQAKSANGLSEASDIVICRAK